MDQLEEIKSKIDLVQLVAEYLPMQKAGRNFKALCPFHAEKTPSFIVSPERQIWKCFGCGKVGDAFGFLMEYDRMDFGEALRFLAKKAGVTLKTYQPSEDEAKKTKLYGINHLAAEFFHFLLLNHPAGKSALDYILDRGISKNSLKLFKIGYSPDLWDGLQKYLVGKKGLDPQDLENAGLIIKSSRVSPPTSHPQYYDRFRHRLMFPLIDHKGNVCGFAGRVLDSNAKEARPPSLAAQAASGQAKYVNTPETLVYHKSDLLYPLNLTKEEIKKENKAVVVEGELDAISSFQIGIKNVVAIKGSALTENQAKLLKRYCENLVLALDADIAGDSAARRGIEIADKEGFNVRVVELEKYKDPDEAAQKEPGFYKEKIKKAVSFYDYLLDSAFKRSADGSSEAKKKVGEEIVPVLAKIENEIVKNHYVRLLAEKLRVNEESILAQIKKFSQSGLIIKPTKPADRVIKPRRELLEEYLLSLCFQFGKTEILLEKTTKDLIKILAYGKIIDILESFLKEKRKFISSDFSSILPAELTEIFNNFYLYDLGNKIDDDSWLDVEVDRTKTELKILKLKDLLLKISELIRTLEKEGKSGSPEWREQQEEFRKISKELASIKQEKEV